MEPRHSMRTRTPERSSEVQPAAAQPVTFRVFISRRIPNQFQKAQNEIYALSALPACSNRVQINKIRSRSNLGAFSVHPYCVEIAYHACPNMHDKKVTRENESLRRLIVQRCVPAVPAAESTGSGSRTTREVLSAASTVL